MAEKENVIDQIAQRIRDEHRKHHDIDWETIAAHKIYNLMTDTNIDKDVLENLDNDIDDMLDSENN